MNTEGMRIIMADEVACTLLEAINAVKRQLPHDVTSTCGRGLPHGTDKMAMSTRALCEAGLHCSRK